MTDLNAQLEENNLTNQQRSAEVSQELVKEGVAGLGASASQKKDDITVEKPREDLSDELGQSRQLDIKTQRRLVVAMALEPTISDLSKKMVDNLVKYLGSFYSGDTYSRREIQSNESESKMMFSVRNLANTLGLINKDEILGYTHRDSNNPSSGLRIYKPKLLWYGNEIFENLKADEGYKNKVEELAFNRVLGFMARVISCGSKELKVKYKKEVEGGEKKTFYGTYMTGNALVDLASIAESGTIPIVPENSLRRKAEHISLADIRFLKDPGV